jgi:hypothetical protein
MKVVSRKCLQLLLRRIIIGKGNCVAVSSICADPFSNMCSTQADNNSRKLQLRCGCQFPWCALALYGTGNWHTTRWGERKFVGLLYNTPPPSVRTLISFIHWRRGIILRDAVSSQLHSIEWYDQWWIGKDLERRGRGLNEALSRNFPAGTEKGEEKTSLTITGVSAEIRTEYHPNMTLEHYHYANPIVRTNYRNSLK